jgi:release factor glutamine methyltransferase
MTYDALLRRAVKEAGRHGKEAEAARLLLLEVSGLGAAGFYATMREEVPKDIHDRFLSMLERHLNDHVPVQHLLGTAWFYGEPFIVTPDVLIPRPETEGLVLAVLSVMDAMTERPLKVLDLGTGSGCIGITLKKEFPEADVTLSDISEDALDVARKNAQALGASVTCVSGDLFEAVRGTYHVIVSNPPYIPENEEVDPLVGHDPAVALYGGGDGLVFHRRILKASPKYLEPGGVIAFEHGFDQGHAITEEALAVYPRASVRTIKDMRGKDRVTVIMTEGEHNETR